MRSRQCNILRQRIDCANTSEVHRYIGSALWSTVYRATALSLPASHRVRQNITSQDPKKRWYRKYNLVRISVPSIIFIDYFSDPTPRKAQGPVCM